MLNALSRSGGRRVLGSLPLAVVLHRDQIRVVFGLFCGGCSFTVAGLRGRLFHWGCKGLEFKFLDLGFDVTYCTLNRKIIRWCPEFRRRATRLGSCLWVDWGRLYRSTSLSRLGDSVDGDAGIGNLE